MIGVNLAILLTIGTQLIYLKRRFRISLYNRLEFNHWIYHKSGFIHRIYNKSGFHRIYVQYVDIVLMRIKCRIICLLIHYNKIILILNYQEMTWYNYPLILIQMVITLLYKILMIKDDYNKNKCLFKIYNRCKIRMFIRYRLCLFYQIHQFHKYITP